MGGKPVSNATSVKAREGSQLEQDVEEIVAGGPDLLWHYTTPAGLLGILTEGALRATALPFLNDTSEGRFLSELMSNSIEKQTSKKEAEVICGLYQKPTHPIAAICFCEQGDLLSQWRGYSGETGFAIGYDSRSLARYWVLEQRSGVLAPVNYSLSEARTAAERYSSIISDAWRKLLPGGVEDMREKMRGMSREEATNQLAGQLPWFFREVEYLSLTGSFHKDSSFSEEREWRFLTSLFRGTGVGNEGPETLAYEGGLKLYKQSKFQRTVSASPIRAIRMGPGLDFDSQEMALRHTLRKLGYQSVDLLRSEVPYRRM